MMMTTVIKHTLDPNRTKPCDDKTTQKEEEEEEEEEAIFRRFNRRVGSTKTVGQRCLFLKRRLLEWCVKMSTRSFERLCVVDVESGTTRDDDDESCSTAERRDETTMKGILLLLFSLALIMRVVVVVVVVLRLVKSEAVVLCVSRHETHESLPLLTRSHDVSSFYALRFPVDEFRVHVHLMRYSNNNKGNSSIREEREIVLSVFDDDD